MNISKKHFRALASYYLLLSEEVSLQCGLLHRDFDQEKVKGYDKLIEAAMAIDTDMSVRDQYDIKEKLEKLEGGEAT